MRDLRIRPAAPATPPQGDDASGQSLTQQVAAGLRELADKVEAQPELISKAADLMSLDFMDSRAPPSEVRPANVNISGGTCYRYLTIGIIAFQDLARLILITRYC